MYRYVPNEHSWSVDSVIAEMKKWAEVWRPKNQPSTSQASA